MDKEYIVYGRSFGIKYVVCLYNSVGGETYFVKNMNSNEIVVRTTNIAEAAIFDTYKEAELSKLKRHKTKDGFDDYVVMPILMKYTKEFISDIKIDKNKGSNTGDI